MLLVQVCNDFFSNVNVILRSLSDENYSIAKHRFIGCLTGRSAALYLHRALKKEAAQDGQVGTDEEGR